MLRIPALRFGRPYDSLDALELTHHRTGEPVARIGQVNPGIIARDVRRMAELRRRLAATPIDELLTICARAADLFQTAALPVGENAQTPQQYLAQLSATTGMPVALCGANLEKIAGVLRNMRAVLNGLTRGLDLRQLDAPIGAFRHEADCLGCVMPSNSPGVHGLWLPAVPLRTPLALKPGREEPWTPLRLMHALLAAGCPPELCGFYPADHAGAAEILRLCGRSMLFGDAATTGPYANDRRVQLHGPGFSKVIVGADQLDRWPEFVPLIVSSIAENGGRSCLNASGVWVPDRGSELADALARELAEIRALPAEDENARLCAFASAKAAEFFAGTIEKGLETPGATDVTARHRGPQRLIRMDRCAYVLPTLVHCQSPDHPLANREFLLPYAAVVECPQDQIPARIGPTLVCTVITEEETLVARLAESRDVERLNVGPIPTWRIAWDQPHEGNLFEHLYARRAFQRAAIR